MRFTAISIENYRQYRKFSTEFKKHNNSDLHLIVGTNGVGKTNILNAITWCLYDEEPHLGDSSRALSKLNILARDEAKANRQKIAIIKVVIEAEDADIHLKYFRTCEIDVESGFEFKSDFEVEIVSPDKNFNVNIYKGEEAKIFVERYMPQRIRQYFFFDGEQLNNYFITNMSSSIKDSIYAISQVDILSRISYRMGKIIAKKQKDARDISPKIEELSRNIEFARDGINKIDEKIAIQEQQKNSATSRIEEIDLFLKGQENLPLLEKQYQELERSYKEIESKNDEILSDIDKFIREYYVNLRFYPYAKNALSIINEKKEKGEMPPSIDRYMLEKILKNHICPVCQKKLTQDDEEEIKILLRRFSVSSETANILASLESDLTKIVKCVTQYEQLRDRLIKKYNDSEVSFNKILHDRQELETTISKFTDKEEALRQHIERKTLKDKVKEFDNKITSDNLRKQMAKSELNNLEKNFNKELNKQKESLHIAKIIEAAKKIQDIANEIEHEMMEEIRIQMEKKTMNYFNSFIWKSGTFDRIELDDKYNLSLYHVNGDSCVGSCSAAERSLLALSFTLALHEISGFDSLLFIDTPVARVSDINRDKFAQVLNKVSGYKQIIMTLTPDEYSKEIKDTFDQSSSSQIKLSLEDEKVVKKAMLQH